MVSWNKQDAEKTKCDLKALNPSAQVKTAFAQKVIFTEEFSVIIFKIIKRRRSWTNVVTGEPGRGKLL